MCICECGCDIVCTHPTFNRPKAQQAHQDHCHYPGDAGSKCIKTMTSSLEDSLASVRKCLNRSRYAYRKAETLILIKKCGKASLTRHVFRHEMKGTSLFLLKVLEKEGIPRKYVSKDFYRYLDRQHRVFPLNTGFSEKDERSTNLLLKRFVRKNFLLPETKKKLYLLELAKQRLENVNSELKKHEQVQLHRHPVSKSAELERISSSLFHEYPQQVARDFAILKIKKEQAVIFCKK